MLWSNRSAVHLAIARALISFVALGQVWAYEYPALSASGLQLERALVTLLLLAVVVGWRLILAAIGAAVLLAVMAYTGRGATTAPLSLLPTAAMLIPVAIFSFDQEISVDAVLHTRYQPLAEHNAYLRSRADHTRNLRLVRWLAAVFLICLSITIYEIVTRDASTLRGEVALLAATLLPWNRLYAWRSTRQRVTVIYDEKCHFCARTLTLFKDLDVHGTIDFRSLSDLPDRYRSVPGVDYREAMVLFREDDDPHIGYHAVRALLGQFAFTGFVVWVMGWPPTVDIGESIYAKVAANRSKWFACKQPEDEL
jgi:predicted DCC family thiol-disulfide oxidoreductase YuxK